MHSTKSSEDLDLRTTLIHHKVDFITLVCCLIAIVSEGQNHHIQCARRPTEWLNTTRSNIVSLYVYIYMCVSVTLWPSHGTPPPLLWASYMLRPGHTCKWLGKKHKYHFNSGYWRGNISLYIFWLAEATLVPNSFWCQFLLTKQYSVGSYRQNSMVHTISFFLVLNLVDLAAWYQLLQTKQHGVCMQFPPFWCQLLWTKQHDKSWETKQHGVRNLRDKCPTRRTRYPCWNILWLILCQNTHVDDNFGVWIRLYKSFQRYIAWPFEHFGQKLPKVDWRSESVQKIFQLFSCRLCIWRLCKKCSEWATGMRDQNKFKPSPHEAQWAVTPAPIQGTQKISSLCVGVKWAMSDSNCCGSGWKWVVLPSVSWSTTFSCCLLYQIPVIGIDRCCQRYLTDLSSEAVFVWSISFRLEFFARISTYSWNMVARLRLSVCCCHVKLWNPALKNQPLSTPGNIRSLGKVVGLVYLWGQIYEGLWTRKGELSWTRLIPKGRALWG